MNDPKRFSSDSEDKLTPFWKRFPRFFSYPMQFGALLRIISFAMVSGLFNFLDSTLGMLVDLVLWVFFLKYALVVLGETTHGGLAEPDGMDYRQDAELAQILRYIGLALILIFAFIVPMHDDIWLGVGNALIALIAPASIMILSHYRSLMQALNPVLLVRYIVRIGYPYLALCFSLFFFTTSVEWLQVFFNEYLSSLFASLLTSGANFYFAVVIFNMIGYVMFQYHELLGIEVKRTHQEAESRYSSKTKPDPVAEKLNALMSSGKTDEALLFMRNQLRMRWEDNDLQWRYQKLLQATGKQTEASDHAREFITKLVNEKQNTQALNLCEHWMLADPEFRLQEIDHIHDLTLPPKNVFLN